MRVSTRTVAAVVATTLLTGVLAATPVAAAPSDDAAPPRTAAAATAAGAHAVRSGVGPVDAADLPPCPDPALLTGSRGPIGTDANVSVFVGGDFRAGAGAAESEGVLAVGGTATFDKTDGGTFNVGVVGFGSQVVPPPGSDMLLGGADVRVGDTTTVDVGHGIGGNVVAGGRTGPLERFATSGGTVTDDVEDPLGPFAGLGRTLVERSAAYAAERPTGTAHEEYGTLTLTGDGRSATQVFTVDGDALGTPEHPLAVRWASIPDGARIIVNVRGTIAEVEPAGFFTDTAAGQVDFGDPRFASLASRTMWHFPEATSVTVGTGDQLLGSVLVPRPDSRTTITASTNGRLLVGGDLDFAGTGNEAHSYPFPDEDFDCLPPVEPPVPTGSLAVEKTLVDPDGVVDPDRHYVGRWGCTTARGGRVPGGAWSVRADDDPQVVASGLPVGARCSVTEAAPAVPAPADPSWVWAEPVTTPSSVVVSAGETATVTVTNTVRRETGAFRIAKRLVDLDGSVPPDRAFSGGWSCTSGGTEVASGAWTLRAGAAAATVGPVPVGADCRVTERLDGGPVPGDPSAVWAPVAVEPAVVTVTGDEAPLVTVTNEVLRRTGSFVIAKELDGPEAALPAGTRFGFDWTCTAADGTTTGPEHVEIAAGELHTVDGVPEGSSCTVTEDDLPDPVDATWTWDDPTHTVGGDDPATGPTASFRLPLGVRPIIRVAFTNHLRRQLGFFAVEKRVQDPVGITAADTVYRGVWSCAFEGRTLGEGRFAVRPDTGAELVSANLPFGTRCSAVEDLVVGGPVPGAGRTQTWGSPRLTEPETVIGADGDRVAVVGITNTVHQATGGASVRKVLDDPDGVVPAGSPFSGTVACTTPDGVFSERPWSATAGGEAAPLVDGLPDGTACSVSETLGAAPGDGHVWEEPVVSPSSFVVRADQTVAVTVTNVLTGGDPVDPVDPVGPVGPAAPVDPAGPDVPAGETDRGELADAPRDAAPSGIDRLAWTGSVPLTHILLAALLVVGLGVGLSARRRRKHLRR